MTNSKNTKRALLASVLSVLLCVAMLVGSTFAWFTDSVTSGKNQIVAGNLDVELEYTTDFNEWKTVEDATELFKKDALWEPGHAEVVYLRMRNAGTLALKYKFGMNIVSETEATNVNGDKFKLSQYLQYGVVEGQNVAFADRNAAIAAVANPTSLAAYSKEGTMLAKTEPQYLALVVFMPETVGNEANYRGDVVPTIELGLNLVATQTPDESDSFDNQYDKDAEYPIVTQGDFEDALENVKPGDELRLSEGKFEIPSANYSFPKGVSIIGEEGTVIALDSGNPDDTTTAGMVLAEDNITLANVKITGKNMGSKDYNSYLKISGNNVTLDNVTIDALYTVVSPILISHTDADNVITIKNSNLYSTSGRAVYMVDGANGTVNIHNTEITGVYPISVNSANSQNLTLNVTDSKLHGWTSYGDIQSASFTNTEFSKGRSSYEFIRPYTNTTFTNCTFAESFKIGAGADGKTYTINNCTYGSNKLTVENVESLLLDMSGIDEEHLKTCTITVDGKSMMPGASSAR